LTIVVVIELSHNRLLLLVGKCLGMRIHIDCEVGGVVVHGGGTRLDQVLLGEVKVEGLEVVDIW
jgi:hypothetical protein